MTEDGHPILDKHHDYMTIWGFWNGPDEALAAKDESVYTPGKPGHLSGGSLLMIGPF